MSVSLICGFPEAEQDSPATKSSGCLSEANPKGRKGPSERRALRGGAAFRRMMSYSEAVGRVGVFSEAVGRALRGGAAFRRMMEWSRNLG